MESFLTGRRKRTNPFIATGSRGFYLDITEAMFTPEQFLPSQWADSRRGTEGSARLPEHNLLLAMLKDALEIYQKGPLAERAPGLSGRRQRDLYQEACEWLFEERDPSERKYFMHYFSFDDVCDYLNLDARAIRRALRRGIGKIPRHAMHDSALTVG